MILAFSLTFSRSDELNLPGDPLSGTSGSFTMFNVFLSYGFARLSFISLLACQALDVLNTVITFESYELILHIGYQVLVK